LPARISASRGPIPLTYCTGVWSSSIQTSFKFRVSSFK
jgi:hypothetical protein